jgi:hypothetical protein
MHRQVIVVGAACLIAGLSSAAYADSFSCKDTETQPECHARLRCKPDEELEACQKRLRAQARDSDNGRDDDRGDDRSDRGRDDDRGDDRRSDRGRDDDDRRSDRGRRGRDDDDGGSRSRGRRSSGRSRGGGGREGGGGAHSFEANKVFGLGLELGEPTGLNGKWFFSPKVALDFGVGAIYGHYYYDDGMNLYGDILFHPVSLASSPSFELPFYVGFGLRYWEFDYCYMNVCDYGGSTFGMRIPFGLSFDFNNAPVDIFMQLVPVFDFVDQDYYNRFGDRRHTGIDGSVGIRGWIK